MSQPISDRTAVTPAAASYPITLTPVPGDPDEYAGNWPVDEADLPTPPPSLEMSVSTSPTVNLPSDPIYWEASLTGTDYDQPLTVASISETSDPLSPNPACLCTLDIQGIPSWPSNPAINITVTIET